MGNTSGSPHGEWFKELSESGFEPKMQTKVRDALKDLVDEYGLTEIANESGVSIQWLRRFVIGDTQSANADRIEYLHYYLTGKHIKLGL